MEVPWYALKELSTLKNSTSTSTWMDLLPIVLFALAWKFFLVICCYLLPTNSKYAYDSDSLQNLFRNIATFKKRSVDILIYGDFSFVSINWNSLSSDNELETEFLHYLDVNNPHHKVNLPSEPTAYWICS